MAVLREKSGIFPIILLFFSLPFDAHAKQSITIESIQPKVIQADQSNEVILKLKGQTKNLQIALSPGGPYVKSRLTIPEDIIGFERTETYLFFLSEQSGMIILESGESNSPTPAGKLLLEGTNTSFSIVDRFAYIANSLKGLLVIDISKPATPIVISEYPLDHRITSMTVSGNRAYLIVSENYLVILGLRYSSM